MLINYLKIAFRNLQKQRAYSLINITGLALGLAIFTLFAVIAGFDTYADRFHKNADNIYAVVQMFPSGNKGEEHTAFTAAPLLPALFEEFPEIVEGTRAFPAGRMIIRQGDNLFYENRILFVDKAFLSIFSFELIQGDPSTILAEPNSIVLTKDAALKYFGGENPLGKLLRLNNKVDVTVTGVVENIDDDYSSIRFDFLVSIESLRNMVSWIDNWKVRKLATFLLLTEKTDRNQFENRFPAFIDKYHEKSLISPKRMYLLPLLDFRLKSEHIAAIWLRHSPFTQYLVLVTGIFVLLIVCINFMNLSTARYMKRGKEIGMRKVIGADRSKLVRQFLGESVIMSLLALPFALMFYGLMITGLVRYVIYFQGDFSPWNHPFLIKYLFVVTILVGLFAGSYPAFYLSSLKPVQILRGTLRSGSAASRLRKILVVIQFSVSIILIILTLTTKKVFDRLNQIDFGYERERILTVRIPDDFGKKLNLLKDNLLRYADVTSVSASTSLPGDWKNELRVVPDGSNEDQAWLMNVYGTGYDFVETVEIKLREGRSHSRDYNDAGNLVVNETLVRELQWSKPIGKHLKIEGKEGTVIGVTEDFYFRSIDNYLGPTILRLEPDNLKYLIVRYSTGSQLSDILAFVKKEWQKFAPNIPFEFTTLNNYHQDIYKGDHLFITIFSIVDIIAIFVSCLGLLGLASYAAQRKTKEIGIRKVLGASVSGIAKLLGREFMVLIIISNIIAIPIACYFTDSLLKSRLAYGLVSIDAGIILLTVFITFSTAVVAVTSQTLKAARANPVYSMKYD